MIPGHEALGIVDEVGERVRDFKPGDRIIVGDITPGWGVGMAGKQLVTGLCSGGKVRMVRLARVTLDRRLNPALMETRVYRGFETIEEALMMLKDKGPDVIRPVVICE